MDTASQYLQGPRGGKGVKSNKRALYSRLKGRRQQSRGKPKQPCTHQAGRALRQGATTYLALIFNDDAAGLAVQHLCIYIVDVQGVVLARILAQARLHELADKGLEGQVWHVPLPGIWSLNRPGRPLCTTQLSALDL